MQPKCRMHSALPSLSVYRLVLRCLGSVTSSHLIFFQTEMDISFNIPSVCIATDNWLDGCGSIPGRQEFFLVHSFKTGFEVHPTSYLIGTSGSFRGSKAARAWSWPLTSIKCQEWWSYTFTPHTSSWRGKDKRWSRYEGVWGSGYIDLRFLKLGISWRRVVWCLITKLSTGTT
jgi:hypothetical protein